MQEDKPRLALKYCGSCNPHIDFAAVKIQLIKWQDEFNFELVPFSETGMDIVIILCGCPRACGNREEVRAIAKRSLLVAGQNIAGKPVAEDRLLDVLKDELSATLGSLSVTNRQ